MGKIWKSEHRGANPESNKNRIRVNWKNRKRRKDVRKRREGNGTYLEGGQVGEKAVEEAKRKGLEDLRAS